MNRDIVFVYDYFYPDYSAGGPVTSLANLARLLDDPSVKIITGTSYYDSGRKFEKLPLNEWTSYHEYTVWYAGSIESIDRAIDTIKPASVVYLNGIFSRNFFLHVLRRCKFLGHDVVISPRGMLQEGALRDKSLKKDLYLAALKLTGTFKGVRWHATDPQERIDIRKHFGNQLEVDVIPNVPRLPSATNVSIQKSRGSLKLVCFSLISRKKNIKFLIDLLASTNLPGITLDIVGPVKDKDYWNECQAGIRSAGGIVNYLGDCSPDQVGDLLSQYHLFVLPTKGENFGHAIVEAMSAFRPVMISEHTPWKDITPANGGFSLPLVTSQWEDKLKDALNWSQEDFDKACVGAMNYFRSKINMSGLRSMYLSLFRAQS